jgi:hypothetical protein
MKWNFWKIFGRKKPEGNNKPFPSDWYLTISDLFAEFESGKRSEIKDPEMTWAREYERSLIPSDYRYPQKGDVYEANVDQDVSYITSWSAPYTGGGTTKLFAGEQIWVASGPIGAKPIGAYLLAMDYNDLESRILSSNDRNSIKYEGFSFSIDTKSLNENFKLIRTGFTKE